MKMQSKKKGKKEKKKKEKKRKKKKKKHRVMLFPYSSGEERSQRCSSGVGTSKKGRSITFSSSLQEERRAEARSRVEGRREFRWRLLLAL